jgi:CheY-like chemotaxis protein
MAANILLVDGDQSLNEPVRESLKVSGYNLVTAAGYEQALSLIAGQTFDLILLAMTLPDTQCLRLLKFLRDTQVACRVIVMTGMTGREIAIECSEPDTPTFLLKSLEQILSGRAPTNLKLQVIKAGDFIKSTPGGNLDMNASKRGFAHIAATGADLQDYTVLIDLRNVTSVLSTTDIYELASQLGAYGETFRRKTAVLVRAEGDVDQAAFFETVALNRGFKVRAFTVFEEAVLWLSCAAEGEQQLVPHQEPRALSRRNNAP